MKPICPKCGSTPWYFGINEVWCPKITCNNHRSHNGEYFWCYIGTDERLKQLFKKYGFTIHVDLAYKETPFSECALMENLEVFRQAHAIINPNMWDETATKKLMQREIIQIIKCHKNLKKGISP